MLDAGIQPSKRPTPWASRGTLENASVPWGLRTVTGEFNNLIPGQTGFGQADLELSASTARDFRDAQPLTFPLAGNDVVGGGVFGIDVRRGFDGGPTRHRGEDRPARRAGGLEGEGPGLFAFGIFVTVLQLA